MWQYMCCELWIIQYPNWCLPWEKCLCTRCIGKCFCLNSKSQICHKLILQVISHQIKDNMHDHHGSIGLSKVKLCRKLVLVAMVFPLFSLLFCVEQESRPKDWVSNLNGRSLPIPSCLDQVTFLPFLFTLFNNFVQGSGIVCSKELVLLLYFPFALFHFDWFYFFFFSFSFLSLCCFPFFSSFFLWRFNFLQTSMTKQKMIEISLGRHPYSLILG